MRFSTLAFATFSIAAVGEAFLIPPQANKKILDDEFSLMSLVDPNNRILRALCKGCMDDGSDGHLLYTLVVSNLGKPALLINGADLTPVDINTMIFEMMENPTPPYLSVPLVKTSETLDELAMMDLKPREVKVAYNLFVKDTITVGNGEIIQITIEAGKVGEVHVQAGQVEDLELQLARESETSKMVLIDAKTTTPQAANDGDGVKCDDIICEFMQKFEAFKHKSKEWGKKVHNKWNKGGCGKKAGDNVTGGNAPHSRPPHYSPRPGGDTKPWHHPHHHHHDHHHHHPHSLFNIFRQVLLPIVIGVGTGMLVSLMGMVVGHFAVMAYRKATGYRRCGQHAAGDEEVNKGLLTEEEYTDEAPPPQYEAGEVEAKGDQKE